MHTCCLGTPESQTEHTHVLHKAFHNNHMCNSLIPSRKWLSEFCYIYAQQQKFVLASRVMLQWVQKLFDHTKLCQPRTGTTCTVWTYWIVLQSCNIGLDSLFHVSSSHQCCSQIDVTVYKIWFQSYSMTVILQSFLQLSSFLVHVPKVAISFC